MATRIGWILALTVLAAGCQSGPRGQRSAAPVSMVPAAGIDEKPRIPVAEEAPRGTTGGGLSTAAGKKLSGEEESSYEFPVSPPPKEAIPPAVKTDELPLPPAIPLGVSPPTLPPPPAVPGAPAPTAPAAPPPSPVPAPPQASPVHMPTLAPPVPAEVPPPAAPAPTVPAKTVSTESPRTPAPIITQKSGSTPVASELAQQLRTIYDRASEHYAGMNSYTLRMRRREVVGGKARPEELILAKFRRDPFSLYLKWVGEEGKGREVTFVQGQYEGLIHTLMAPGDMFLFAGKHFKVTPDSPLVKSNCRYAITEAGLGPLIARFGRLVSATEKGESQEGTAKYLGRVMRPEFDAPVDQVVQTLPAKYEGLFPAGGQRNWFFDTTTGFPVLFVTMDEKGREVEYYCHDRIQSPANLDDDDFNPYRLWKAATK